MCGKLACFATSRETATALLKIPEGHFLTQIYLPCAYAFHHLLDNLIDKELHYYLAPHHICLYWDAAADASESGRSWVIWNRPVTAS